MPQAGSWHTSPPFISPPLLIILLPILAFTLFFLAVPPLLSAASNALRPVSVVKTSWDSLNILLVVLAILCGVFARRNDDEPSPQNDAVPDQNGASSPGERVGIGGGGYEPLPPPQQQQHWFGFSEDTKLYDATPTRSQSPATGVTRIRRSSSSYPDLRQWDTGDDRYQFRFFDDFEIEKQSRSPLVEHRERWLETQEAKEEVRIKEIPVDTFEVRPTPTPAMKSPPPPPPPPPPPLADPARTNPRRTRQKVESEITEVDDSEFSRVLSPPSTPPTAPSPPRPSMKARSEHKHGKSERRKSNVKREIAMVWASVLSNQRKRKKKKKTNDDESHNQHYNNVEEVTNNTTAPPPTPPPPPPPPPPPSVFHSLFRKGLGKSKKIHSVSAPPPPPPPPPLTSSRRWSTRKSRIPPPPAPPPEPPRRRNPGRPPLPNKAGNYIDEAVNAGNQSPLIPAPPPPPPFKMTAMKFTVRGGFVNIRSNQSSRCSSPEREHIDVEVLNKSINTSNAAAAADVGGPVFCASPDVNLKAATFIARLRGEWRLEKLNSMKEKSNDSLPPPGRGYSL